MCAPAQICVPYTVSDPDGLTGLVESLVSGPPAPRSCGQQPRLLHAECEHDLHGTRPSDRSVRREDEDEQLITVQLNRPPTSHSARIRLQGLRSEQRCETYGVADPDGLTESLNQSYRPVERYLILHRTKSVTPDRFRTYTFVVRATIRAARSTRIRCGTSSSTCRDHYPGDQRDQSGVLHRPGYDPVCRLYGVDRTGRETN